MPNINVTIKNRIAYANKEEFIVGGNDDYNVIFSFDNEWDNVVTKTARFSWGDNTHDEVFVGNECEVPRITNATILKVGIFIGNKRATTDAFVPCKISTVDNNGMPPNPEDDVYTQILEKLNQAIGEQTAVPKGGKEGQVLGKKSDKDFDTDWIDTRNGSDVEANPTEEASEDLSRLKVGETVYDVVDKAQLNTKVTKPTTPLDKSLLAHNSDGIVENVLIGSWSSGAIKGRIPAYVGAGNSNKDIPSGILITGTPVYDGHAANKKYVDDKFNGSNKAVSFVNYSSMISSLNSLASTSYNVGQNVMIITLNVPDLWVSEIVETSVPYTYVSDDDFVSELETNGFVQVGYFKLSALETQKVDLTEYVKQTQIAQQNGDYGLVKLGATTNGLQLVGENLAIAAPSNTQMKDQNRSNVAITTSTISRAVKYALIDPDNKNALYKGNWTAEEQAKARETLGITSGGLTLYQHIFSFEVPIVNEQPYKYSGYFYSTSSKLVIDTVDNNGNARTPRILITRFIGNIYLFRDGLLDATLTPDNEGYIVIYDKLDYENFSETVPEV